MQKQFTAAQVHVMLNCLTKFMYNLMENVRCCYVGKTDVVRGTYIHCLHGPDKPGSSNYLQHLLLVIIILRNYQKNPVFHI